MWFAIMSEDVADSTSLRQKHRPAHLARLHDLASQDRLLVAGPHPKTDEATPAEPSFTGSLVVAMFDSLEDAQAWAAQDPFILNQVYARTTVKPFKLVLP